MASGIGSLESIPWLQKSLKIRAQNLGSMTKKMKTIFFIDVKKNEYIHTPTIEVMKKNKFIRSLTVKEMKTNQSICSSTTEGMKKN
jgi:hypothetical protein